METNKSEFKETKRNYQQIMNEIQKAFSGMSDNYRQKLVYNLLNAVKGNDQKEFFWIFFRALAAKLDKHDIDKLVKEIGRLYPLSTSEFEKIAYSVILGIMSAGGERR